MTGLHAAPEGWKTAKLAEISDVISGIGFPVTMQGQPTGDLPFFKVGDISEAWKSGDVVLQNAQHHVSQAQAKQLRGAPLPRDTTVFAKIGAAIALNRRALLGQPSLVDNNVMGVVPRSGLVDARYLFHFMCTVKLAELSRATTVPSVRKTDVEEIQVPLPPLAEQRKIVAEIEKHFTRLDVAVGALRRLQTHLRRYRAAVLKAAFKPDWPRAPLGSLLREPLRNGHSAPKSQTGAGIRTLKLSAVTEGIFSDENTKITGADPARVRDLWLHPGDLLIERSNTPELVGTAHVYRGPRDWAIFPDLLIRVRLKRGILDRFVEHFFASEQVRDYFRRSAQGIAGSMPKISQPTIEALMVPIPSVAEQQQVTAGLDVALTQAEATERFSRAAMNKSLLLRASVLRAAFDGRLVAAEMPARITA